MDVRRIAAVAAFPCLCLLAATEAEAQSRRSTAYRPIAFDLREPMEPLATDQRVREESSSSRRSDGMLRSVTVTENAEIGVGRFGVGTIARPRTNMERERMMERENRSIAGAGMRVRF